MVIEPIRSTKLGLSDWKIKDLEVSMEINIHVID